MHACNKEVFMYLDIRMLRTGLPSVAAWHAPEKDIKPLRPSRIVLVGQTQPPAPPPPPKKKKKQKKKK